MSVHSGDSTDSEGTTIELNGSHVPKAYFKCRPQSHPFSERQVAVVDTVKIGRSVAKSKPATGNAIFDCKVLSRNHALLWYEDGKFWLKDTKSSNGTFVNNQRLGKGNEESAPREVYSGDIVQLGVDVMENTKKVTHGCIIAQVTLYHPDGNEAQRKPAASGGSQGGAGNGASGSGSVSQEQLYQLSQYLQEALHRESTIGSKLDRFRDLLDSVGALGEASWSAVLNEERLLAKLELMENQLALLRAASAPSPAHAASVRDCLSETVERQAESEEALKSRLEACLAERGDALQRVGLLERSWQESRDECRHLRDACGQARERLQQLSAQYDRDTGRLRQEVSAAKLEGQSLSAQIRELGGALVDQNFADIDRQSDQPIDLMDDEGNVANAHSPSELEIPTGEASSAPEAGSAAVVGGVREVAETAVQAGDSATAEVAAARAEAEAADAELRMQLQVYKDLVTEQQDALDVSGRNVANLQRQLESALQQIGQLETQLPLAEAAAEQPAIKSEPTESDPAEADQLSLDWILWLLRRLRADADSLARAEQLLATVASTSESSAATTRGAAETAEPQANRLRQRLCADIAETDRLRSDYDTMSAKVAAVESEVAEGRRDRDQLAERYRDLQASAEAELTSGRRELQRLTDRNRLLSAAAALPLLVLLVSLTVSLYAWLTGGRSSLAS